MATVRLNQWTRDAIIAAIINDIPRKNDDEITTECQAALVKAMCPTARKLFKEKPGALRAWSSYDLGERVRITLVIGDADPDIVLAPWFERQEAVRKLEREIRAAVNSCSTVKQLEERYPEFAHYAPKPDAPVANLPAVISLVPDLLKLGWPKKEAK